MRQAGYNQYLSDLSQIKQLGTLPPGIIIHGSSQFLVLQALTQVKALARKSGYQIHSFQARELDAVRLYDLCEQGGGLFSEKQMIAVQQLDQNLKLLSDAPEHFERLATKSPLVFAMKQDKIPVRLQKTLPKSFQTITCLNLQVREIPRFIQVQAKIHRLKLEAEAGQFISESLGQDLFKIDNELRNLSLIYADKAQSPLKKSEIGEALGFLREDHGFRLEEYLLAKQRAKALNLIDDLIKRGESPLAILGILAFHCRKALDVLCPSPAKVSKRSRPPTFIQQKFQRALKAGDRERYVQALRACHQADISFKTSPISEQLPLAHIILTLTS